MAISKNPHLLGNVRKGKEALDTLDLQMIKLEEILSSGGYIVSFCRPFTLFKFIAVFLP